MSANHDTTRENLTLSDVDLAACRPLAGEGGRVQRALCPFHGSDHQRSLRVQLRSGRFVCFACGAWGYLAEARERWREEQQRQAALRRPPARALHPQSQRPGPPRTAPRPAPVPPTPRAPAAARPELAPQLAAFQAALPGSRGGGLGGGFRPRQRRGRQTACPWRRYPLHAVGCCCSVLPAGAPAGGRTASGISQHRKQSKQIRNPGTGERWSWAGF